MLKRTSRSQADPEFLNSTDWYNSLAGQFQQKVIIQLMGCHSVQKDGKRDSHLTYINIDTGPMGKKQRSFCCQKSATCRYPQRDCHTSCLKKPSLPLFQNPHGAAFYYDDDSERILSHIVIAYIHIL